MPRANANSIAKSKRSRSVKSPDEPKPTKVKQEAVADAIDSLQSAKSDGIKVKSSPQLAKKLKQLEMHRQTPFPQHERPTPHDCKTVCDALAKVHGGAPSRPAKLENREGVGASCGLVPDVLDALIRTILSQNTTSKNSMTAKRSLDARFVDYDAVRLAPQEEVAEALAPGGLAQVKSKVIKKILDAVWERNGGKNLSLDDLHHASDEDAMRTLVSFDGVGPKTAACVALFCLGHNNFAVDTHVFRLSKALGWVPAKANRETAYQHLNNRIPDDLKYALHSLLVRHGRSCIDCAAGSLTNDPVEYCPLKPFLRGKRPRDIEDPCEDETPSPSNKKSIKKSKKAASSKAKVEADEMHGVKTE